MHILLVLMISVCSLDEYVTVQTIILFVPHRHHTSITQVLLQLQPDPSEETSSFFWGLIYNINNAIFGYKIPVSPQLTWPHSGVVNIQAVLSRVDSCLLVMTIQPVLFLFSQGLSQYPSLSAVSSAICATCSVPTPTFQSPLSGWPPRVSLSIENGLEDCSFRYLSSSC